MTSQLRDLAGMLQGKAEEWAKELIQLDSRNSLLNFRITKTATLDLTSSPERAVGRLLSGEAVRLGELFGDEQGYREACTRTRNLVRMIRSFSEEQGVDVGRLVFGRVSSDGGKRGGARAPIALRAPLLLYQIAIQARTASENDFSLQVTAEPELNPVLRHCLEREYGVRVDSSVLDELTTGGDLESGPHGLAERVFRVIADAAGEQGVSLDLAAMVAVGICNYAKLPMVDDLMSAAPLLAEHDLIVALASGGLSGVDAGAGGRYTPAAPDTVRPQDDYLVLDADSSQYRAVATALADRHVVIDGPPGTGKSQTIANLIAAGAAAGSKILFVAEKRAAIEAVTNRLTEIGLGGLVLDLHQSKVTGRAVAAQLAESFEQLVRVPVAAGVELDRELEHSRGKLNDFVQAVHTCRAPWQLSPYQVREALVRSRGGIETAIRFGNLAHFTPEVRLAVEEDLRHFVANGGLRLIRRETPWWKARVATVEDARQVLAQLEEVTTRTLSRSQTSMRELVSQVGLPEPRDFQGWDRTLNLLSAMSDSAATLGGDIFARPLIEYQIATTSWRGRRSREPKLGWRRRSALLKELRLNRAGITDKSALRVEVTKVIDQLEQWRRMSGAGTGPADIGDFRAVGHQYGRLRDQLAAIAMCANVALDQQPLDEIERELQVLAGDRVMVPFLPDLTAQWARLRNAGLEALLNEIATRAVDPEQSVALFRHALMHSLDEEFILTSQPLREFRADSHNRLVQQFQQTDQDHRDLAVRRILRHVARAAQQVSIDHPTEHALLRSEAKKKRSHRKLRKLVSDAPNVMLAVRPCWAMSPLVVSQALPPKQLFDLVIFDEASQVQPHDAITSIMRGRRLVVAGDDKQLPPTTFFDRSDTDDGEPEDGENVELRDYESILTTLQPLIANRCRLQWHYRSQDERLIQFSNEEIYNRELVTFPGAHTDPPVRLDVVDGRVPPGERGSADAEIDRVIELVLEHAADRPHESLGVITLGVTHQKKLDMALRRARERRPELDEFFAEDRGPTQRFFIKNIETVQGDERDAIILSVGVAKNATGGVHRQGFSVLNQEGTERRVNVAVTRAKRRMTVVCSFPPGALQPDGRTTGTEMLRRYLEAASHHGRTDPVGRTSATDLNGFEQAILDGLTGHGVLVIPQWGVSGYRIDFALAHPDEPGRMVLAVEADGDSYHRTASARDRDRLRQQHLERLGWRFHRVWASAWFADPEQELRRIIEAWEHAVKLCDAEPAPETIGPQRSVPEFPTHARPTLRRPDVHPGLQIDSYSHQQVVEMFLWRMSDGLLLDGEERTRQIRTDLGFKRRGRKIDARLSSALDEAQRIRDKEES
ncbi:AAA domain-containing protein [Nocardia araoensis]|uniref:AAA domain-containing protein n=1 Tax=Nocardia araoensis TaxID=228600 RepID=UPI000584D548|nr:AAA domain-containing protein [Nocardia araoensis]